jgi:hypothetical protein
VARREAGEVHSFDQYWSWPAGGGIPAENPTISRPSCTRNRIDKAKTCLYNAHALARNYRIDKRHKPWGNPMDVAFLVPGRSG